MSMSGPFAELAARLAAKGFVADDAEPVDARPYKPHAEFERGRDEHGDPRFHEPTDCAGMLMFVERSGPIWLVRCDACGWEGGVPARLIDPDYAQGRLLERCGIPDALSGKFDARDAEQQGAVKPCRAWLREFKRDDLGASLPAPALWGAPGRGKSHLLCMMVGVVIRRHRTEALYRSSSQLFDELREGLDGNAYAGRWQRVLSVPVLALDDLGVRRMTEWQQDRLFALIDHRMTEELPLLIAANMAPDAWPEHFGARVASRLRGMVVPFELGGADRREQPGLGIPF